MKEILTWAIYFVIIVGFVLLLFVEIINASECKAKGGVYMQTFGSMECLDVKTIK